MFRTSVTLPSQRFLQFSKLMKFATDVFAQNKFSKDILNRKFVMDTIHNYLITESEVVTGKSQTEALPY